jgi:cytochrome c5
MAQVNRSKMAYTVLFATAVGVIILAGRQAVAQAPAKPAAQSPAPAPAPLQPAAVAAGKQVFTQNCAACHTTGALGAPKLGDKAAWAPRLGQGVATLDQHALHGFKAMPAKGGNPRLSDADVQSAVGYMVAQAQTAPVAPVHGLAIQLPPEKANFKDGRGVEIARAQCMICHSADYITTQAPLTNRKQWLETVYKMQLRFGAPIPDSQIDPLVNYLVKYYGDKDQPRD